MKFSGRLRLGSIVFAIIAIASGAAHAINCPTRHFYNHERVGFWIIMRHGSCTIGSSPMMSNCLVPPGQNAEFHFANLSWGTIEGDMLAALANSMNPPAGNPGLQHLHQLDTSAYNNDDVTVLSADGGRTFPPRSFDVDQDQCEFIHPDDTGILVMNDPTNGDITVDCRGVCATARRDEEYDIQSRLHLEELRRRAHEVDITNRFNNLKNAIAAQGCVPLGIDENHLWAQCRTLDGRLAETSLNRPLSCDGMPTNPTGKAEIAPGAGRPENANGKLICVGNYILMQCRHFYAAYPGRPNDTVMDVACRTRNYQDSDGERKWGVSITPDCEFVTMNDAEELRSYPYCTRQP